MYFRPMDNSVIGSNDTVLTLIVISGTFILIMLINRSELGPLIEHIGL